MKLDSKLIRLLAEYDYERIVKSAHKTLAHFDDSIKYRYLSRDVIEFTLLEQTFEHNILTYNFSTKEYAITQKVDFTHPVSNSYTIPDDRDEIWSIFNHLHLLNTQDSMSYVADWCAGIVFYENGDWEGTFDLEVFDRIVYTGGVYKYQVVESDEQGCVRSDTEITSTNFFNYQELEAFLFQKESVESFSESVMGVVNLLRDYHN